MQRMTRVSYDLSSLLLSVLLWTLARGDTEVSCVFTESCILPCSFQGGTDVVVHWTVTAGDLPVHSYYHSQDQLAHQDQRFRGRTSLFKDQISRGNASLQLTGVEVQDQGRYRCFTSTIRGNKDSLINLRVDAPVGEVDLQQVENNITCSSEGIYPEPELTWSTSPPSYVTFKSKTEVQRTEQLLYNISSSLILSDTDLNFICSISTRSNRRRATLFKPRNSTNVRGMRGVVVAVVVVAAAAAVVLLLVLYCKRRRIELEERRNEATSLQNRENHLQEMKTHQSSDE